MKNTIAFLLPGLDTKPIGGYKMVYEYANRFVDDGYDVVVIYPQILGKARRNDIFFKIARIIKHLTVYFIKRIKKNVDSVPQWFELDQRVKKEYVLSFKYSKTLNLQNIKYIATSLPTSFELVRFTNNVENNFYFIQGFENWFPATLQEVYDSYKLPLKKITISPWLRKEIRKAGSDAAIIENGLDFEYFKLTIPISSRSPYEVAMLFHLDEVKRTYDAIEALKLVKTQVPQLHITVFGTPNKPNLPDWFDYYKTPNKEIHNKIYNTASIFVAPSRLEGMGLTPAESMICGCAVCCTDNPGFEIFAKNNETALISTALNIQALSENILRLIKNDELRIKIAQQGNDYIKRFTWEHSYKKMKDVIIKE